MKYIIVFTLVFLAGFLTLFSLDQPKKIKRWEFQSIDTMKYSRDQARETLNNRSFSYSIDKQLSDIARTGATHVAIDTPYDDEFLPVLKLWVKSARRNKLKVFFRGNLSGWEGWFGYQKIGSSTHTDKIKTFIENNPDLFADGDVFSSCPECEIGSGMNKKSDAHLHEYRKFLINEYQTVKNSFAKINKNVKSNYYSMTGDFALRIMDHEMTKSLDGVVVIDHYVKTPEQLERDIRVLAGRSGGKIVLGEFGVPIPNLQGYMTESEQKIWIERALAGISTVPEVIGVNYWVNLGGSTTLWEDGGRPRAAVEAITQVYSSKIPQ